MLKYLFKWKTGGEKLLLKEFECLNFSEKYVVFNKLLTLYCLTCSEIKPKTNYKFQGEMQSTFASPVCI